VGGGQKVVAVKSERKGKDASVKWKGKEKGKQKGKEKETGRQVSTKRLKKSIKSVVFIEDEDSSSSDDKPPPATRPKPKPAYRSAANLQGSVPDSAEKQKDAASTPGGEDTAQHATIHATPPHTTPIPVSIPPPPLAAESPRKEPAKLGIGQTAPTSAIPSEESSHRIPDAPAVPTHRAAPLDTGGQYPPLGPRPPLRNYPADERNHFYHRQPLVRGMDAYGAQPPMPYQNSGQLMYSGDGDIPVERYRDYYGYGPPPREYYAPPYPHAMQPRGQSPYIAHPPAPHHQQPLHNPYLQPDMAVAPRGVTMSNAVASSSRLSPSDTTKPS